MPSTTCKASALSPRIRNLADQRLYPVARVSEEGVLKPLFRGQAIQRSFIVRGFDDLHCISAPFKDGTMTAVHSLVRQVAYGQLGILTDRDLTSQLNRTTCLSLLLNVIAVWNTHSMQAHVITYARQDTQS